MKLTPKTKTLETIDKLENYILQTNKIISAAIININQGHKELWSLPDNEVEEVLQQLLENGTLRQLFENHYICATYLNLIQDNTGSGGPRAIAKAGKEYILTDEGKIKIVPWVDPILSQYRVTEEEGVLVYTPLSAL